MAQPESSLYQEKYNRWLVQSYVSCKRPSVASLLCSFGLHCITYSSMPAVTRYSTCVSN